MDTLTIGNDQLPALIARLSPRQKEIFKLFTQGKSNKEVCKELTISKNTLRIHVVNARRRVGVDNRIQLIVLYAQWWATEGKEQ